MNSPAESRPLRWPLGVCRLAWTGDARTAAVEAAALGFDHLDLVGDDDSTDLADLALPVGIQMTHRLGTGWASPAPGPDADWERFVARLQAHPTPRIEPWAGSLLGSDEAVLRILDEAPHLRLVIDTGHVTQWGGDVLALLPYADHVQLRQAAPGVGQLPADQGTVDLVAVLQRLAELGYEGLLSVEYFDMPGMGWPLADPIRHAAELAGVLRPILRELAETGAA